MRRSLTTTLAAAAGGALLLLGSGCGGEPPTGGSGNVDPTCAEYRQIVNDWSEAYGAEIGAVEQARANGDEDREEEAVAAVKALFLATADGLREQSEAAADPELASGFTEAADGAAEIGEQIESYEDVVAAPGRMNEGPFADGGEKVDAICAG